MARNKLIAKYTALNTENLPERIFDKIKLHIASKGIANMPYLELSGRWTGKLIISNGGWHNDFDLVCPVLSLCRLDRHGELYPDMTKIWPCVREWVERLTTPTEDDEFMGASDEIFDDSDYVDDDINEFHSAAYRAELLSFAKSDETDIRAHLRRLSAIDDLLFGRNDDPRREEDDAEEERRQMEARERRRMLEDEEWQQYEASEEEMEEIEKMMEEEESKPTWEEFVDNLRHGRYGDLPEDYDGLAAPKDEYSDSEDLSDLEGDLPF